MTGRCRWPPQRRRCPAPSQRGSPALQSPGHSRFTAAAASRRRPRLEPVSLGFRHQVVRRPAHEVVRRQPITWRDEAAPWPQPLETDRALVTDPDSIGVRILAPTNGPSCTSSCTAAAGQTSMPSPTTRSPPNAHRSPPQRRSVPSSTPPLHASSTPADQQPPEHKIMYGTAKKTWELPPTMPGNSGEPAARPSPSRHLWLGVTACWHERVTVLATGR